MTESAFIDDNAAPRDNRNAIVAGIGKASAVLVLLLALGAFFLSYESLRDLAANSGAIAPTQAWMFPLVVDGSILVFSLSALRASLSGESTRWYMGLVVAVTVVSVGLNSAHASGGVLARFMASIPPLLLFAAFESVLKQWASTLAPIQPKKQDRAQSQVSKLGGETPARRLKVMELDSQGLSRNAIARQLGVSAATVRRDLAQLEKAA